MPHLISNKLELSCLGRIDLDLLEFTKEFAVNYLATLLRDSVRDYCCMRCGGHPTYVM